jgi:hypothetical protein
MVLIDHLHHCPYFMTDTTVGIQLLGKVDVRPRDRVNLGTILEHVADSGK